MIVVILLDLTYFQKCIRDRIDRFYSPKYFGSQMSRQEILFQENLRILTRSKSCAESFTDEEYEQHYKELMEQQGE